MRWVDLQLTPPRQVRLRGKGKKERLLPLWRETADALHRLRSTAKGPDQQHVFVNYHGQPLTRDGIAYILSKHASAAAQDRLFGRQIEYNRQVRLQSTRGETADLPQPLNIQPAGVTLIYDVGQQEAIRDDDLSCFQGRPDDLGDQLRSAGHEQQRLAHTVDVRTMIQNQ